MKVLMCHNYYQQPGGEDESFAQEVELLRSHGHPVICFTRHNNAIKEMGRLRSAMKTIWNRQSSRELRRVIRRERPDIMHCTNTFPLISPSAYYAAKAEGVAVVQSLRNYRLLCPGAFLLRNGTTCGDCIGAKVAWRAVKHRCYRNSRTASAVVAAKLALHRAMGTWNKAVDAYYALTEFSRQRFIEGGLPEKKLAVKPNFLHPDPKPGNGGGGYAIFVGRLSPEKGVETLLAAWTRLGARIPLKIVGDGPLRNKVSGAARNHEMISRLGPRDGAEVLSLVSEAAFLVIPSLWYEGFPRTILEAFAKGTPVVASKLGSMAELVKDGRTGVHFQPGDADDLANKVTKLLANPKQLAAMRHAVRDEYLRHYTAETNYTTLMSIYQRACESRDLAARPMAWKRAQPVPSN